MKQCKKCQVIKPLSDFHNHSKKPDGKAIYCKLCNNSMMKPKTKEQSCRDAKAWALRNPEKKKKVFDDWYAKNKHIKRVLSDTTKEKAKLWRANNNDKINTQRRLRAKNKTPHQILDKKLRDRFHKVIFKMKSGTKFISPIQLVGCDLNSLKAHIESQFLDGMSWYNHGNGFDKWNIDHIQPLCTFDLHSMEQQLIAFNYKNLRPLWFIDNMTRPRKNYGKI